MLQQTNKLLPDSDGENLTEVAQIAERLK